MRILVIDGQGGNIGSRLVKEISSAIPDAEILAVGTNNTATQNMLKAGAHNAATGENPVRVCARTADIITGPIGIIIADALMGEVTPGMAAAIGSSNAKKILIPMNRCDNIIAGVTEASPSVLVADAVARMKAICEE